MLDLGKIVLQVRDMAKNTFLQQQQLSSSLDIALKVLNEKSNEFVEINKKVETKKGSGLFLEAKLPYNKCINPPMVKSDKVTVIGTDGSQIPLLRDEMVPCFVINTGTAIISYGTGILPDFQTEPQVFYKEEDIYHATTSGTRGLVTSQQIDAIRMDSEAKALSKAIQKAKQVRKGNQGDFQNTMEDNKDSFEGYPPIVAFLDGTLIQWQLERIFVPKLRKKLIQSFLRSLETAKTEEVPILGYISSTKARDLCNTLALANCPGDLNTKSDLCKNCGQKVECQALGLVTDAMLFSRLLRVGERSSVFKSRASILTQYTPSNHIFFFYLRTESEVARIEVPKWVVDDESLLELVHSTTLQQVEKGLGYPIILSESHNQAVVTSRDRMFFIEHLREAFGKSHLSITESDKRKSKRIRFV